MKNLFNYIIESLIFEKKYINFGTANSNYNQCIILAGGPGSGKGYIRDRSVLAHFKKINVDDLKKQYIKLQKAGKIDDKYDYDLTKAEDTALLHMNVKKHGWKNKQRENFWSQRQKGNQQLPNVLWDMTSSDAEDVLEIIKFAKPVGYNVTLVWVVCNVETAIQNNNARPRRVPDNKIREGNKDAHDTVTDILENKYPIITDGIDLAWVAFSAGYKRIFTKEFEKDQVIKIKKDADGNFDYASKKEFVEKFFNKQMPIDPDWDQKQEDEKIRKSKLISSITQNPTQQ